MVVPKEDIYFDDDYLRHSELHLELIHELKRSGNVVAKEPFDNLSFVYLSFVYRFMILPDKTSFFTHESDLH